MGIAGGGSGPILIAQVQAKHQRFVASFTQLVDGVANQARTVSLQSVRSHPGFTPRTGALQKATKAKVLRLSNGRLVRVSNALPYAPAIDLGAKAHVIRPKEGYGFVGPLLPGQSRRASTDIGTHRVALRWYVGGRPVFARVVHHPGNRPYSFLRNANWAGYMTAGLLLRRGMRQISNRF